MPCLIERLLLPFLFQKHLLNLCREAESKRSSLISVKFSGGKWTWARVSSLDRNALNYDNCASIFTYTSPSNEWLLSIHNYASFINDLHLWRIFESFYFVSIVILRMFLIPVFCFTYSSFRILFSPESFSNWFEQSSRKWNATFHVLRVYFSASALEMLSDFFSFLSIFIWFCYYCFCFFCFFFLPCLCLSGIHQSSPAVISSQINDKRKPKQKKRTKNKKKKKKRKRSVTSLFQKISDVLICCRLSCWMCWSEFMKRLATQRLSLSFIYQLWW